MVHAALDAVCQEVVVDLYLSLFSVAGLITWQQLANNPDTHVGREGNCPGRVGCLHLMYALLCIDRASMLLSPCAETAEGISRDYCSADPGSQRRTWIC